MMDFNRSAVALAALFLGVSVYAAGPPPTDLYIALGDSITAASMAETSPPTAAARASSRGAYENKKTLSWASGEEISSHYLKLKAWMAVHDPGAQLEVLNAAVPGITSAGLTSQIAEAANALATGKYRQIAYVTILIGANDACNGLSADTLRANLNDALDKIAALTPGKPVRVLVISLPQIPQLNRKEVREARTYFGMSCATFRNSIGLCRPMLNWTTDEELQARLGVIAAMNSVIRESVQGATLLHAGQMDVAFVNSFAEADLRLEGLAADCFHPNKMAHGELSEAFWAAQPWFK